MPTFRQEIPGGSKAGMTRTDNSALKAKVEKEIESRISEFKGLLREIIRIPTDNPPGDTVAAVNFMVGKLSEKGIQSKIFEPLALAPNIVSSIRGASEGPALILNGHIDQFPVENPKEWSTPPYEGITRDGKILGRGASDMKAGTTISFIAFMLMKELGIPLTGRLTLIVASDEETGGKWGSQWLIKNVPDALGDAILDGEPSGPDNIYLGHKGLCWFSVITSSPGGHGATPGKENAITKMMRIAAALEKIVGWKGKVDDEIQKMLPESFDGITMNIGTISGGVKNNVIPQHCEMSVDIRIPNGLTTGKVKERIKSLIVETGLAPDEVKLEWSVLSEPTLTPPNSRIVSIVRENARLVAGTLTPRLGVAPWGSDARFWQYEGVPAVIYGPTSFNMGGTDEYILEKDFEALLKIHAFSIIDFLC